MIMKYPKEYLDEIRLRLRVSQVVGKHVQLKKRGKEFVGLSPFKNEKTPSFTVNDEKGFYHCFSTGEHGNIFDFLMKTKSLGFGEAVKVLAAEAGMQIYKFSKTDKIKDARYTKYKDIYKEYSEFFHKQLFESQHKFALNYLKDRKISEEIIKKFKIGFVPRSSTFLDELKKKYSQEEINSTGLFYFIENKNKFIDRFNNRIIFPINNLSNDPIAFGGRVIENNKLAKYINSPETEFYKKSRQLFNLNNAKDERSLTSEVIIVEGYMDVISLYSAGIKNVISNSGTAITENQINLVWKFFKDPIICLDGDQSGQSAALRIAERLFPLINEENKIFFSILPEGNDPDDIIKKKNKQTFLDILNQKIIIQKYIWETYVEQVNKNNPYEVSKFEKQMRKMCQLIKDETLRKYILEDFLNKINNLTPNLNVKPNFNFTKRRNFKVLNETKKIHFQKKNFTRDDLLEFSILYIMIYFSGVAKVKINEIKNADFLDEKNDEIKQDLLKLYEINSSEKEIQDAIIKSNPDLVKRIDENSNLKIIINKKNYNQIQEILKDLLFEISEKDHKKKIESLEKKVINNMDENAYLELVKLKSQINRE